MLLLFLMLLLLLFLLLLLLLLLMVIARKSKPAQSKIQSGTQTIIKANPKVTTGHSLTLTASAFLILPQIPAMLLLLLLLFLEIFLLLLLLLPLLSRVPCYRY